MNTNDIRPALTNTTRHECDEYRIRYVSRFNERRVIEWLTHDEAQRRAAILRARSYTVTIEPMF